MIEIVKGVLATQGIESLTYVEYPQGEMDLLCNRVYYEFKSSDKLKSKYKALDQIQRAIKHGQCEYGYLVTPSGVYDILKEIPIIRR